MARPLLTKQEEDQKTWTTDMKQFYTEFVSQRLRPRRGYLVTTDRNEWTTRMGLHARLYNDETWRARRHTRGFQ